MLILLSPTKKQLLSIKSDTLTQPAFINEAGAIVDIIKKLDIDELKRVFKVSDKIALENFNRFKKWRVDPELSESSEALFCFTGEAFNNLDPQSLNSSALSYLKSSLIILSGLYGVLRASDKIMPYRLDIGDSLKVDGLSLYKFWKERVDEYIKKYSDGLIINLASKEYYKEIDFNRMDSKVITPEFRTMVDGKLKNIPVWSKKMRGLLTRKLAELGARSVDDLMKIKLPGYRLEIIDNSKYYYIKE